jgi:hypothetical protein
MSNTAFELVAKRDTLDRPAALTPWTLIHVCTGVTAYVAQAQLFPRASVATGAAVFFVLHALYEAKDLYKTYVARTTTHNTLVNSVADQAFSTLGFLAAARLSLNVGSLLAIWMVSLMVLALPQTGRDGRAALSPGQLWDSRG